MTVFTTSLWLVSQCTLSCPLGYAPNMDCTECVPVHICVTNNPCQNEATCTIGNNSNTDYTCLCPANYTGQNCESEYKCYLKQLYSFFFQYVLHLVHLDMSQYQLVLVNVFQCISVSPMILVRMEQHVISVVTATLTTPAHACHPSLTKIAVSIILCKVT